MRPGNAPASLGALGVLRRLVPRLRVAFPKARLRVRLDGGFACPEVFEWLEGERLDYVVAMGKNAVLTRAAESAMIEARALPAVSGQTAHVYTETSYQAQTWAQPRRVIIKAEVVHHPGREPRDNPRFVVTNLRQQPQWLYETVYCARGDIENRIKELQHDLAHELLPLLGEPTARPADRRRLCPDARAAAPRPAPAPGNRRVAPALSRHERRKLVDPPVIHAACVRDPTAVPPHRPLHASSIIPRVIFTMRSLPNRLATTSHE